MPNKKLEAFEKNGIVEEKILSEDSAVKLSSYVCENCVSDTEPFSASPYRGSVALSDILNIDKDFLRNIEEISKEYLQGEFEVIGITSHFKDKWLGAEEHWHQDYMYNSIAYDSPSNDFFRLFVALDNHTRNNGCLMSIGRSHNKLLEHEKMLSIHGHQKYRIKIPVLDQVYSENGVQYNEMRPGHALLFTSLTPHASCSNQTPNPRKALQIQIARKNIIPRSKSSLDEIINTRKLFEIEELNKRISKKKGDLKC